MSVQLRELRGQIQKQQKAASDEITIVRKENEALQARMQNSVHQNMGEINSLQQKLNRLSEENNKLKDTASKAPQ